MGIVQDATTMQLRNVGTQAQVTKVYGRRIECAVGASNADEQIAHGAHERVLIDVAKLLQRQKTKFGLDKSCKAN